MGRDCCAGPSVTPDPTGAPRCGPMFRFFTPEKMGRVAEYHVFYVLLQPEKPACGLKPPQAPNNTIHHHISLIKE